MMMMDDDKSPKDISPAIMDAEITGEISHSQHERWRCLVLDIELRAQEDAHDVSFTPPPSSSVSKRFNFSPMPSPRIGPSSSRRTTTLKNVFNFKNRNNNAADTEEGAALVSNISRTWSLTNLLTLRRSNKSESLPVTPLVHSNPESMHGRYAVGDDDQVITSMAREHTLPIRRTRSVPTLIDDNKDGNAKPLGLLRVIPTPSRESKLNCVDGGEDVPEEEAVCRICMVELGEDSEAFKMECMCKGELALSHKACTIKWFTIKGNITCDVCKQVVKNLPVTLLRVDDSSQDRSSRHTLNQWQDVPVLVIVSMLAYFCFLEQLLVMQMKSSAVAVALPFSCIIGLLASIISTTMVKRNCVWIFATIQFGLVVLFGHVFYSVVKQPVMCIVLATMIGFGLTMSGTTAINEFFKWRRSHTHHQEPASTQVAPPHSQTA